MKNTTLWYNRKGLGRRSKDSAFSIHAWGIVFHNELWNNIKARIAGSKNRFRVGVRIIEGALHIVLQRDSYYGLHLTERASGNTASIASEKMVGFLIDNGFTTQTWNLEEASLVESADDESDDEIIINLSTS